MAEKAGRERSRQENAAAEVEKPSSPEWKGGFGTNRRMNKARKRPGVVNNKLKPARGMNIGEEISS